MPFHTRSMHTPLTAPRVAQTTVLSPPISIHIAADLLPLIHHCRSRPLQLDDVYEYAYIFSLVRHSMKKKFIITDRNRVIQTPPDGHKDDHDSFALHELYGFSYANKWRERESKRQFE